MPCMHCGQAHWSSRCKSLGIPPEGFSKENGGGGHDHGDDEEERVYLTVLSSLHAVQIGSQGGGFQSNQQALTPSIHASPNRPSSVAV